MKNQNLLITSALASVLAFPAMADIAANANSAKCDNGTLDTYQGESTLQAQWDANTINLKWYTDSSDNNGQEITPTNNAAATCTYDDAIVLPTNTMTKEGYEFAGWRVRTASVTPSQPQQTTITLSSLYDSGEIDTFAGKSLNPGVYCEGMDNGDWYGNDEGGDCTDSRFSGLNNGEWTVTMPNGNIVKGEARCSTVSGSWAQTGNPTDDLDLNNLSNGARYCWCKATSGNTGSGFQPVSSSSWVFRNDYGRADGCADRCAAHCASHVFNSDDFRRAVFGVTE